MVVSRSSGFLEEVLDEGECGDETRGCSRIVAT